MPTFSLPGKPPDENKFLLDWVCIPALFLAIVLLGNYGIFLGHSFFTDENAYIIFRFSAENMKSSGWRPDLGLGITYFYGDPGAFHVWSLLRWWVHLFPNPLTGFNIAILTSIWAACFTLYVLLKTAAPNLGRLATVALACLIAFGSLRHTTFSFQSYWGILPVIIPIITLLIHNFSKKPTLKHYFLYTLILTLSLVLGSSIALLLSIIYSVACFLAIIFFNGWHKKWETLYKWCSRFVLLNVAAGTSILILAGWTFYSIFLEAQITGYVRDATYGGDTMFTPVTPKFIFQRMMRYIQSGIFSPWANFLGIQQIMGADGRDCFSPVFPIMVVIFLLYKTRNLWEYSIKFLFFGFIFYQEFMDLTPSLTKYIQNLLNLRPPTNFETALHVLGIVGLGICLSRIHSGDLQITKKWGLLIRVVASVLSLLYAPLLLVSLFSIFAPETLTSMFLDGWKMTAPYINNLSLKELAPTLISENVQVFHETMGLSSVVFYGSTLAILVIFASGKGVNFLKLKRGTVFAGVLLFNQVFLTWAIYPLNHEPLIWERQVISGNKLSEMFSPTDRIMRVGKPFCREVPEYYECINKKFFGGEFGAKRRIFGYMGTPALELSAPKSFTQKEINEFIQVLIKMEKRDWTFPYGFNRLLQRDPPLYSSKFYDVAGVKYLVSQDPIPTNDHIKLVHSSHQFYLYRYLSGWPYYYLADRVETIKTYGDMYLAEKGTAYIWENESGTIPSVEQNKHDKMINLRNFQFDRMEFEYDSEEPEFLVVSDAWHPNWSAIVNGSEATIVKANGVFKGISLPPGKGTVELVFNNSPYKPGIWISIFGWTLFLGGWFFYNMRTYSSIRYAQNS